MAVVWSVHPGEGLGPLRFGMTHEQVAEFEDVMGPLDETTEETLSNGRLVQNEFRDRDAPLCSFDSGRLTHISIGETDIFDIRFNDASIFKDDPKHVYSTLGRAAGSVFWVRNSVAMPSLYLELIGFVVEYDSKKRPLFESKNAGFTWPKLRLFDQESFPFNERVLVEIKSHVE